MCRPLVLPRMGCANDAPQSNEVIGQADASHGHVARPDGHAVFVFLSAIREAEETYQGTT